MNAVHYAGGVATLILLRHGRTTANASGVLAGWSPDVHLDAVGVTQAAEVAARILEATRPVRLVASPLTRCQETAAPLAAAARLQIESCDDLGECHYGAWTGRSLTDLAAQPLWTDIQQRPSSVTFPPSEQFAHESIPAMQARAVSAAERLDAEVEADHGPGAVWVAVSHGDVIKALLAHALATPLDEFQRLVASPASVSVVRFTSARPYVLRMNDTTGGLGDALSAAATTSGNDATVGGSSGATTARA